MEIFGPIKKGEWPNGFCERGDLFKKSKGGTGIRACSKIVGHFRKHLKMLFLHKSE